ncbi:hypothetical protein D9M69_497840 [compost metagenome]
MLRMAESLRASVAWLLRSSCVTATSRTLDFCRAANTGGISLPEPRSSASPLMASMCSTPLLSSRQSIL